MNVEYWDKARAFHGHECPGLAIGVRVCEAAMERMGLGPAVDEELVCIAENDACGVDAVQALLGCTLGKGNLIYKGTGKQAFIFIRRDGGRALRFYLKATRGDRERAEYQEYLLSAPLDELFDCQEMDMTLPERARIFSSVPCEVCGESTSEQRMRLQEGKRVCLSCFREYDRGW